MVEVFFSFRGKSDQQQNSASLSSACTLAQGAIQGQLLFHKPYEATRARVHRLHRPQALDRFTSTLLAWDHFEEILSRGVLDHP